MTQKDIVDGFINDNYNRLVKLIYNFKKNDYVPEEIIAELYIYLLDEKREELVFKLNNDRNALLKYSTTWCFQQANWTNSPISRKINGYWAKNNTNNITQLEDGHLNIHSEGQPEYFDEFLNDLAASGYSDGQIEAIDVCRVAREKLSDYEKIVIDAYINEKMSFVKLGKLLQMPKSTAYSWYQTAFANYKKHINDELRLRNMAEPRTN